MRPSLRQPVLIWNDKGMYMEVKYFEMEVRNTLLAKHAGINETERTHKIRNWLGRRRIAVYENH